MEYKDKCDINSEISCDIESEFDDENNWDFCFFCENMSGILFRHGCNDDDLICERCWKIWKDPVCPHCKQIVLYVDVPGNPKVEFNLNDYLQRMNLGLC